MSLNPSKPQRSQSPIICFKVDPCNLCKNFIPADNALSRRNYLRITVGELEYSEDTTILLSYVEGKEYYRFYVETNCRTDCHSSMGLMLNLEVGIIQTCTSFYDNLSVIPTSVFVEQTNVRAAYPFHTRPMTNAEMFTRENMRSRY